MVNPNSSPCDEPEGGSVARPERSENERVSFDHPAADAAGEHTAAAGNDGHRTTDEIFAELVAGLDDLDDLGGEVGAHEPESDQHDAAGPPQERGWDFPTAPWVSAAGPRDHAGDEVDSFATDLDEHFVPPDPRGLLSPDPVKNLAWAAVIAGPLVIFATVVLWPSAPSLVPKLAGAAVALGLALLLWRMPASRDVTDDDSGAVV